jgi:uncharacterized protein (UPF0248 family)
MINDINTFIYNNYISDEQNKPSRERGVYWPSQANAILANGNVVGTCLRNSFYNIKRTVMTNPPSTASIRKMKYGCSIEDFELEQAQKSGLLLARQVPFEKKIEGIRIRGKIDGIGQMDLLPKGMEYKTGGGYYFSKQIWGSNTEPGSPRFGNLLQVILYLDGFRNHPEYPFDECYIIYIDRGSGDTNEFRIKLQSGFPVIDGEVMYIVNVESIYQRYLQLDKYITINTLPPCDYHNFYNTDELKELYKNKKISKSKFEQFSTVGYGQDQECSYCNWLDRCREDTYL